MTGAPVRFGLRTVCRGRAARPALLTETGAWPRDPTKGGAESVGVADAVASSSATGALPFGRACALRPSIKANLRGDPSDSPRRGCAPTDPAEVGEAEFALDEGHEELRTELKLCPYGGLAALGDTDLGARVSSLLSLKEHCSGSPRREPSAELRMHCAPSDPAGVGGAEFALDEGHAALWTELMLRPYGGLAALSDTDLGTPASTLLTLRGHRSGSPRRGPSADFTMHCARTDAAGVGGAGLDVDRRYEAQRTELKLPPYGRLAALGDTDLGTAASHDGRGWA